MKTKILNSSPDDIFLKKKKKKRKTPKTLSTAINPVLTFKGLAKKKKN